MFDIIDERRNYEGHNNYSAFVQDHDFAKFENFTTVFIKCKCFGMLYRLNWHLEEHFVSIFRGKQSKKTYSLTLKTKAQCFSETLITVYHLDLLHSRCVLNQIIESDCEKTVNKHEYIWYLIASYPPSLGVRYQI